MHISRKKKKQLANFTFQNSLYTQNAYMTAFVNQKYDLQAKTTYPSLYKYFRITQFWKRKQESP